MNDFRHLADAFRARDLATPMHLAFSLAEGIPATIAAASLRERNFDQAPVTRHDQVIGYVLRRRLDDPDARAVGDVTVSLGPPNLVSAESRVADLLDWIADPGFLFVLDGRDLMGFVTVTDFNKQPCRAYLYLLLATFEIRIADYLRQRHALNQQEVFVILGRAGIRPRELYQADVANDIDADPMSYLGFPQLLAVVGHDAEGLDRLGSTSRDAWELESKTLAKLRNSVMHPTRSLLNEKAGLLSLREHRDRLVVLTERLQPV
jgi:hypothetical protein